MSEIEREFEVIDAEEEIKEVFAGVEAIKEDNADAFISESPTIPHEGLGQIMYGESCQSVNTFEMNAVDDIIDQINTKYNNDERPRETQSFIEGSGASPGDSIDIIIDKDHFNAARSGYYDKKIS